GAVKTEGGEILVRMKERRDAAAEFGSIPIITAPDGTEVLLEDLGTVREGFEDVDLYATFEGQRSMEIDVYRVGNQTPISVSKAVREHVERLRQTLPEGISIDIQSDRSDVFKQRLDLLLRNGFMGLALVFIFLALFLEARLAFWVSLGIPISFLGSFVLLPSMDVSVNMISLFAFIITLGIVVDDAIVVGENVYSFRKKGLGPMQAAVAGAREVAMPVTFSVLTNIMAFLPMFFVPGIMGKMFVNIPAVVAAVFAISLIESLFILPAHLGHSKGASHHGVMGWLHRVQQGFSTRFEAAVANWYGPFLRMVLRNRYTAVATALALLMISLAFIVSGRMGMTLFMRVESDFSQAELVLPYGTPVARTEALTQRIVNEARKIIAKNGDEALSLGVFAQLGRSGSHSSVVRVYLTDPDIRPMTTGKFTDLWRERVGDIPGVESLRFRADARGPGSGDALSIELSHRDMDVLERASMELAAALTAYPNVTDVDDGFAPGKQQLNFTMEPEGRNLGLSSMDVARQVRHGLHGVEALKQQRGRNEVTVRVRLPEDERSSEYDLESMVLLTASGREVPLVDAVAVERGRAYTSINRRDGRRVSTVSADVQPADQAGQVIRSLQEGILPELTARHAGLSYSFEGRQADIRESMTSLFQGLAMALLGIYAMLAIPFRSYWQPLIIMFSIPFGLVGAVAGHLIMGYSLSLLSMFGMLALSGVVVNDSLVLVDFANRARRAGAGMTEAILGAAIQRFRPVLLTTLTTAAGLAPMIMETSVQAKFLIPMAISLGFGIVFATLITLGIVPCLYMIIEDVLRLRKC
ncbi:MAG: efflux RND transporter permease subunit, partial [Deltaproteobacteria bacterium]|nr:efflux RND transporter permease subunit [Deltaproteobacteria bacterium]